MSLAGGKSLRTVRLLAQVSDHEPCTLVFASHGVEGQPLTRVFYEVYRDHSGALHARAEPLPELLARQNSLVAGVQRERLTLDQAKGLPFDAG